MALCGHAVRVTLLSLVLVLGVGGFGSKAIAADDRAAAFDRANRLYEEGRYPEAAAAYEELVTSGPPDTALYFNLGNACFKSGRTGRAIAAYLRSRQLSPRDPSVRFNLQFARKAATGTDTPPGRWWQRGLGTLTLNEWTVLAACGLWLWCGLLAVREWRPRLRPSLRGYAGQRRALRRVGRLHRDGAKPAPDGEPSGGHRARSGRASRAAG
jgi:tetratricopeptide (TPR) repeat protein